MNRPVIFISAVSRELRTARDLVAKTLIALGYEPKWPDIAPAETGDLRTVLRKWVDDSAGVIQLVGHCYGFAAKEPDADFGQVSYTQYEALYARQQGKPVWYILLGDAHEKDGCACEPVTLHQLQDAYREKVKGYGDLYHRSDSLLKTENIVLKLCEDLALLRAEAEKEHRAVLAIRERVLGAEHPDVFQSCFNLALCLEDQKKLPAALAFIQRAEAGCAKVLGPGHPDSKDAKRIRERIEAAMQAK